VLAIRLPANVVAELGLKAGDEVRVTKAAPTAVPVEPKMTREELIEQIRRVSTPLPPDYKFDREEANARR
jgi:antitoxin MazE